MRIRLVKSSEIDRVMELVKQAKDVMYKSGIYQWDDNYPSREILLGDIKKGELIGVEDEEGVVIGFACINTEVDPIYESVEWTKKVEAMSIHRLVVDITRGKSGVATMLFDYAEELAKKRGIETMHLDTYSENFKAQKLFAKMGYKKVQPINLKEGMKEFFAFEKDL